MGRRSRQKKVSVETTSYTDPEGNVLTLRNTVKRLGNPGGGAAASVDDQWRRGNELLFERLAVRWEIAGLPLEGQKELLGRYRMASSDERRRVRDALAEHLRERYPDVDV